MLDELPPHSDEAERGILGCIMLDASVLDLCQQHRFDLAHFYDLRHRATFDQLLLMHEGGRIVTDQIQVCQWLKDAGEIDNCGGLGYIASHIDSVPSAANAQYYIDTIAAKYRARVAIKLAHDLIAKARDGEFSEGTVDELRLLATHRTDSAELVSVKQLLDFDIAADPSALIGIHYDGETRIPTRWIGQGYCVWLIGPSGVGKSSLGMQFGASWAIGEPVFSIEPRRPLRVLYVQAENDRGDMAEAMSGIANELRADYFGDQGRLDLLDQNFKLVTEWSLVGAQFCHWLHREIVRHRAEVVIIDPILSFFGIDIQRQAEVTQFLRKCLNPVLKETGVALIGCHHTGKPKQDRQANKDKTTNDYAYDGIGSSDLTNFARAIMTLAPRGKDAFELVLAKRGRRAGARHPDGTLTDRIWLRHADKRIFWEQTPPPAEPEDEPREKGADNGERIGRPSKVDQIIKLGLGLLTESIVTPISQRKLIEMMVLHCESKGIAVKATACRDVIAILVGNKALKHTEEGYVSGKL